MNKLIKGKAIAVVKIINSHSTYAYHPVDYSSNNSNSCYFNNNIYGLLCCDDRKRSVDNG